MEHKVNICSEKRAEHRMEPWGTPQVRGAVVEEESPRWTEKLLSVRYDTNHFRTFNANALF